MIAAAMLVACLAQGSPPAPSVPPVEASAIKRALALDPRSLPRAPEGRWKDFDPKKLSKEDVPDALRDVAPALAAHDAPAAIEALQRCLVERPDFPPAWHQLGVTYFRLQRYGDTATAFERYLEAVPDRVAETRALGHAYYSLGRHADAKAHYERVLARAPDDVEAIRGLALSILRLGNSARALELLRDVVAREPKHREAWTWIAQILYDAERNEEALAAATTARDLAPFEPRPWFFLAKILVELGRDDDAKAASQRFEMLTAADQEARMLESRLEYDPRQVTLLSRLAQIHRGTGDLARARDALTRALEVAPDDRELRLFALDVLESLGDASAARAVAQSLESRFEDDVEVWRRLEAFYAKLRDRPNQMRAGERHRRLLSGG